MMLKRHKLVWLLLPLFYSSVALAQEDAKNGWDPSKTPAQTVWDQFKQTAGSVLYDDDRSEQEAPFSTVWRRLTPKLDELAALEAERPHLPESSWLGRDQHANQQEMNQILDEAIAILSISNASTLRQDLAVLEQAIEQTQARIATYHQEQVSAPLQSHWKTTVEDYTRKIEEEKQRIVQYQREIAQKKHDFLLSLNALGVEMNPEQLEVLLASVVGNDMVRNMVVYSNVRRVSQQLMELTQKSQEDLHMAQRYYGMYTLLLKIVRHLQNQFIAEIDQVYLPRMAQIKNQTTRLMADAKNLLDQEVDDGRRHPLQANLQAQELTLQTADLYEHHLNEQRHDMKMALDKTQRDLRVALNTYETVKVSGELVRLLRSSTQAFDDILNIQVPDLLVFQNRQMKQEFSALTTRLKQ